MDGWTSDIYKEREKKGARWIDPIKELELYMEAKCKLTSCWIRDVMVQKWLHRGREKRALLFLKKLLNWGWIKSSLMRLVKNAFKIKVIK